MKIYESGEMYLETILQIIQEKGSARAVDVVNQMGLAKSSVSEGLKNLKNNGYIDVSKEGSITLTSNGMEIATNTLEKHYVLTNFLQKIGVEENVAEKDACRIEHVISEETFEAIKKFIKN